MTNARTRSYNAIEPHVEINGGFLQFISSKSILHSILIIAELSMVHDSRLELTRLMNNMQHVRMG
jgi:hypothetical protein